MSFLAVLSRYWRFRLGATAIEYALIAGLIAVVLVPGLLWVRDWQERVSEKLNTAVGGAAVREDRDDRARVYKPREDRMPSVASSGKPKP
jgi:Flp pilus assembly pilin Flp